MCVCVLLCLYCVFMKQRMNDMTFDSFCFFLSLCFSFVGLFMLCFFFFLYLCFSFEVLFMLCFVLKSFSVLKIGLVFVFCILNIGVRFCKEYTCPAMTTFDIAEIHQR